MASRSRAPHRRGVGATHVADEVERDGVVARAGAGRGAVRRRPRGSGTQDERGGNRRRAAPWRAPAAGVGQGDLHPSSSWVVSDGSASSWSSVPESRASRRGTGASTQVAERTRWRRGRRPRALAGRTRRRNRPAGSRRRPGSTHSTASTRPALRHARPAARRPVAHHPRGRLGAGHPDRRPPAGARHGAAAPTIPPHAGPAVPDPHATPARLRGPRPARATTPSRSTSSATCVAPTPRPVRPPCSARPSTRCHDPDQDVLVGAPLASAPRRHGVPREAAPAPGRGRPFADPVSRMSFDALLRRRAVPAQAGRRGTGECSRSSTRSPSRSTARPR